MLLQLALPASTLAQSAAPLQAVRGTALDLTITPDGVVVVLDPDGAPWIQRLGNGNNWNRLPGTFRAVRAGQDASLWAIGTDDQPYRLTGSAWRGMPLGAVRDLAVTPDGVVYTLGREGALQVWAGGHSVATHTGFEAAERLLADEHGLPWLWNASGYLARFDGTRWARFEQFAGSGLSSVTAGADGTMLLIDGRGQLHRWNAAGGEWTLEQVPQPMRAVAIGPNGKPWFVAASGQLLASEIFALQGTVARTRPAALFTKLLTWKRVRGAAQWLSVGADGTVVTIDPENRAWRWKGGDNWTPLPGTFRRAAVAGNGAVWGINLQSRLMRNATGQWIEMGIDAAEVAAGPNEEVWVIDAAGALGRYDTTTRQWVSVPGGPAKALAVGRNGEAWIADANGAVRNVTRATEYPGIAAVSIGAGPDGTVYATTAERELYWLDTRDKKWKPASGVALAVAVGPSGSPWIIGAESALFASGSFINEHNAVAEARAAAASAPQQVLSLAPPPASVLPTNVRPLVYTQVTGSYADVGAGADGSIFAAGADGGLYCFSNPERRFLIGSRGSARRVAVSPTGVPWITNANGEVSFFENNNWTIIPGFKADDIGFGADRFVYATQANIVHRYDAATRSFREITTYNSGAPLRARRATFAQGALWGVTAENTLLKCTGTQCQPQPIGARDLSAGPDGTLMVLDNQGNVQRYNPRSGGFTPAGGTGAVAANAITVGPQGLPWLVSTTGDIRSSGLFNVSRSANLANCAERFTNVAIPATPQVTVQLTANNDTLTINPGASASIIANDLLNGARPATSSVSVNFTSSSANLTHSNGSVTVATGTAAGSTLNGNYTICALPGAAPCSSARVSVTVGGASAIATADTATVNPGATFNLLANDTLNGAVPLAAQATMTFTSVSASLTQAGGLLTLNAAATPGSVHTATYRFCAVAGAPCSGTVNVTITATATATATADTTTINPGATFNLLANDTLNGAVPLAAQVTMTFTSASASLTQVGGLLTLNAGATPGSVHTATYRFCAVAGAPCSATVNVSITATAAATAVADAATINAGATFNLLANDLLNGVAPTAGQITMTFNSASASLTQVGGLLTLNAAAAAGSVHTATYSFCATAGAPCSGTVNVSITAAPTASATADTATINAGATFNLLANDLLNGVAPTAGQITMTFNSASASLTQVGGLLTLNAAAAAGSVHTATYSFCATAGAPCSGTVNVTITTTATVPGAPVIGTATIGNASVSVAFTAPASNGGSAITNYAVTSNPGAIVSNGNASPVTVTGLTNGTAYTFTVTATNAIGTGAASAASTAVTPLQLPTVVVLTATANGVAAVDVDLTETCSPLCTPVTNHTVTMTQTSAPFQVFTANSATLPVTVNIDPQYGGSYNVTATGTNALGTGAASAVLVYP